MLLKSQHRAIRPATTSFGFGDAPTSSAGGYSSDHRLVWLPDAKPSRVSYLGAPQTVRLMARSALSDRQHFETRQLCEAVCEGLDSKDYTSEVIAMYNLALQRCRYMRDPKRVELVRAPHVIAELIMKGHRPSIDCDDYATFLAACSIAMGGTVEIVTVAFSDMFFDGERQYSHVFIRVLEPRTRTWIVLDPVAAEKTPEMLRRVRAAKIWPIAA